MRPLALLCLLVACGDSSHPPVAVIMSVGAGSPAYGTAPFPTDAVRDGDRLGVIGGLDRVAGSHSELIAAHLAALDGFGVRPVVEFFVDGALDPATVPTATSALEDAAMLVDVDPASPARGRVVAMDW